MIDRLRYAVADAVTNLARSRWAGLASVATIAVAFLIVGIFLLLTLSLTEALTRWRDTYQVTVFLDDRITADQLALLKKRIANEAAVRAVTYLSKAEALATFKRELKGRESLLEGLGENPIPASFQLKIREEHQTPQALRQLGAFLTRLEGVEEVQYGQEWIDRMAAVLQVVRLIGLSIGIALGVASLFIVSNTVRLAIYARAEEIEVLRLVGATKMAVRLPFLLEGLIQGGAGAGLAVAVLYGAYRATLVQLQLSPGQVVGLGVGSFLPPNTTGILVGVGAALGALGSLLSVGRLLRT
jgi:cell division transport system permease protein